MPPLIVDTRERQPYEFPGISNVIHEPLDVGDYTHDGYQDVYAVERKELSDLAGSLASERTRFENEIRRANGYANRNDDGNAIPGTRPDHGGLQEFAVVIEADRQSVNEFNRYLKRTDQTMKEARGKALNGQLNRWLPYLYGAHPNAILGTLRSWPQKYDTLEFIWATDREGGKQKTLQLLDSWYLRYGGSI